MTHGFLAILARRRSTVRAPFPAVSPLTASYTPTPAHTPCAAPPPRSPAPPFDTRLISINAGENTFLKLTNASINVVCMNAKSTVAKPRGRRPSVDDFDLRDHMLDVAMQLFAERGIAATTVAQIAEAAGVTSAMVHYHFTNREQLLDAIVEERLAQVIAFVWRPTAPQIENDPFALVTELVDRFFDVTHRMPWLPSIWLREIIHEGGLLRERMIRRIPLEHVGRFAERIRAAQQAGTLNPALEPAFLFHSIIALVMLPLATAKLWQSARGLPPIDRDVLHRHVRALLASGLQPPAATLDGDAHSRRRPS